MARRAQFERDSSLQGLLPPSAQIAPLRHKRSPSAAELSLSSARREMRQQAGGEG